jgi:cytoplasmic iron level regulating protein YaaA (DUF328/UPF0246 family)
MIILLHSSKTMKPHTPAGFKLSHPKLLNSAKEIANYLKTLCTKEIKDTMKVSDKLAEEVKNIIERWGKGDSGAAMFTFRGDIYSGLQVDSFNKKDIEFAQKHLLILSGLYGVLRPLDEVYPYRLEMGYKLPDKNYNSLYEYWGDKLSSLVSANEKIINLTSLEYGKAIIPKLEKSNVIAPVFYTYNSATRKNTTVAVHSKIARGAFAHWLIKNHADGKTDIAKFNEIGYNYEPSLSSPSSPAFVCKEFGGKGLSVRLK